MNLRVDMSWYYYKLKTLILNRISFIYSITHIQVYEIHNMDGKQTSTNTNFYKSKQYSI